MEDSRVAIGTERTKESRSEFEKGKPTVRLGRKAMGLQQKREDCQVAIFV